MNGVIRSSSWAGEIERGVIYISRNSKILRSVWGIHAFEWNVDESDERSFEHDEVLC